MNLTSTRRNLATAILAFGVATGSLLGGPFSAVQPAEAARDLRLAMNRVGGTGDVITGQQFQVKIKVSNPGSGSNGADDFARNLSFDLPLDGAHLVIDGAVTGTWTTGLRCNASTATRLSCTGGDLQRGGTDERTFTLTAPATAQTVNLVATVDPAHRIAEANDNNNTASLNVNVVGQPELLVTSLSGAETIGSFAHEDYRATVKNQGNGRAKNVKFVFRGESLPLDFNSVDIVSSNHQGFQCQIVHQLAGPLGSARVECTGGDLQPNEAVTFRLRTSSTVVVGHGHGNLTSIIDAGNFITESDEDNNSRSLRVNF